MQKHPLCICLFLAFLIAIFSSAAYGADSGCVNCHTNEKMMRALHAPVKVDLSEGVG